MPEGDTIHKIAGFLAPRLTERTVQRLQLAGARPERCTGRRVARVFAQGKHLFIELDDGLLVRSHLGMYGAWHRYRKDEQWRKPRWQASLELATESEVYVCFNAKEVELIEPDSVRQRVVQTRLGPDLVRPGVDVSLAVRRARELASDETPIADVLLDQRIASGIGNVYKSEVLFIERRLPRAPLGAVSDDELARCYATAHDLLRRNLHGGPRVTRFERDGAGRLWVYERGGLPCLRCEGRIRSARSGRDHRATYWCPDCQR